MHCLQTAPLTAALAVAAGGPIILQCITRGSPAQPPLAALLGPGPLCTPCSIAARRQRAASGIQGPSARAALLSLFVLAGPLLALLPPPPLRLQGFQPLPLKLSQLLGCTSHSMDVAMG